MDNIDFYCKNITYTLYFLYGKQRIHQRPITYWEIYQIY